MTTTSIPENEKIVLLPLSELIDLQTAGYPDSGYLRPLDTEHVENLVASSLDHVPPIVVTAKGDKWVIIDGYHRVAASKILEQETIPAIVRSYPSEHHALDAAFQANLQHGLILSREDKEKYVLWLAKVFPELAQTEIASRVRLTQATVSRMLSKHKKAIETFHSASEVDKQEATEKNEPAYVVPQIDNTRKLLVSMASFFENERAILGSITGNRSETKRAKALVAMVKADNEVADMFDSLARSLNSASTLIREKLAQKG